MKPKKINRFIKFYIDVTTYTVIKQQNPLIR